MLQLNNVEVAYDVLKRTSTGLSPRIGGGFYAAPQMVA